MAFKIFNNLDEEAKKQEVAEYPMLAAAIKGLQGQQGQQPPNGQSRPQERAKIAVMPCLVPASSVAVKSIGRRTALILANLPSHVSSVGDHIGSLTVDRPFKAGPHHFPRQLVLPTWTSLALWLKTDSAWGQMPQ